MKRVMKRIRTEKGITQAQLAKTAGLSIATIQGYEQGKFSPSFFNMINICDKIDFPLDTLLDYCQEDAESNSDKSANESLSMVMKIKEMFFTPPGGNDPDSMILTSFVDRVAKASQEERELYYRIVARLGTMNEKGLREVLHSVDILKRISEFTANTF